VDEDSPPVLVWSPAGEPPPNAAVAAVEVGGGLPPLADARSTVAATIDGSAERDSLDVRLMIDDRVHGIGRAPAGATAVIPFPARPIGRVSGWVEIDPDALRGDDRRYFVTSVRPPPTVALANRSGFIDEALAVLADAGRIVRGSAADADIVIAPGAAGVDAVRDGAAVVVLPPARPLELPATNRRLADAGVPWRYEAPAREGGEARIALGEAADPLLASLEEVRLRRSYALTPESGAINDSVLIRLRDGGEWAVRGARPDGGRYVLIGSPITDEAGNLPGSPAMLPLTDRLVGAWTRREEARTSYRPGERLALPTTADGVRDPDGERISVSPTTALRAPDRPGIYEVLRQDSVIGAFAVNPPALESRLERLDDSALRAALPGAEVDLVHDPGRWDDTVYVQRLGREVWRPLALIVLAVLLIEGLVATAGRGTPRETATGPGERSGTATSDDPGPRRPRRPRVPAAGAAGTDAA
ncbi:MAG: hypothetical protein ACODAE_09275, partial [Gemmatimonadota bacterium]